LLLDDLYCENGLSIPKKKGTSYVLPPSKEKKEDLEKYEKKKGLPGRRELETKKSMLQKRVVTLEFFKYIHLIMMRLRGIMVRLPYAMDPKVQMEIAMLLEKFTLLRKGRNEIMNEGGRENNPFFKVYREELMPQENSKGDFWESREKIMDVKERLKKIKGQGEENRRNR
jgi:hypothetical protein